jgi:hypothetical protein
MHIKADRLRQLLYLRRKNFRRRNIFLILFAALLVNCGAFALHLNQTNAQETREKKRILPLRATESADGTQVSIVSDAPLTDYTTSRSGDRYYVIIPQADAAAVANVRGRGLEGVQAQKRGNDLILTFRLQPGATARVSSRFNRLDVAISTPFARQTHAASNSNSAVKNTAPVSANTNSKNSNASAQANNSARNANNAQTSAQASPSPRKANEATKNANVNQSEKNQSAAAPPNVNSSRANSASNSPSQAAAVTSNAAENAASNQIESAESNEHANVNVANSPAASTAAPPAAVSTSTPNFGEYGESAGGFLQRNWQWLLALLFIAAVGIIYFFLRPFAKSRAGVRTKQVSPKAVKQPVVASEDKSNQQPSGAQNQIAAAAPVASSTLNAQPKTEQTLFNAPRGARASTTSSGAPEEIGLAPSPHDPFAAAALAGAALLSKERAEAAETNAARAPQSEAQPIASQSRSQNIASQTQADFASPSNPAVMTHAAETPEDFDLFASSSNTAQSAPENSVGRSERAEPLSNSYAASDFALASSPPQPAYNDADFDLLADEANGEWRIPIIAVPQFNVSREAVLRFERRVAERRQGDRRKGERRRGDRRQSGDHENAFEPRMDALRESSPHDVTDGNGKRAADFKAETFSAQSSKLSSSEAPAFALSTNAEFDDALLTATKPSSNAPKQAAVDAAPISDAPVKEAAPLENPQAIDLIGNFENGASSKADEAKNETAASTADEILELEPTEFAFAEPTSFNVVKRERPPRNAHAQSADDESVSQVVQNGEPSKAIALHDDFASGAQSLSEAKSLELKDESSAAESSSQIEPLSEEISSAQMNGAQSAARIAYISQLALENTDEAFREICGAFDDPSPEVRIAAARAINRFHGDRAAAFTRALREASPERRRKIGRAIAECGLADEAIDRLNNAGRERTYDAFSLLFLMAKAGELEPLVRAVETHHDKEIRMAVIKLLALSGQPDALPPLRRLAVKGSLPSDVRSAVMEAIYQLGASQSAAVGATRIA